MTQRRHRNARATTIASRDRPAPLTTVLAPATSDHASTSDESHGAAHAPYVDERSARASRTHPARGRVGIPALITRSFSAFRLRSHAGVRARLGARPGRLRAGSLARRKPAR